MVCSTIGTTTCYVLTPPESSLSSTPTPEPIRLPTPTPETVGWTTRHTPQLKQHVLGPLLEVAMSKKCMPLWREAHFQVKMCKTPQRRTTFGRRRKSARRCGPKHISMSKCTKHTILGPLLEVEMSKKCTSLWREAHFEVKMYKARHVRGTFGGSDVERVHAVVARSTFRSQNVKNTRALDHFWRFRCRFTTLHYI